MTAEYLTTLLKNSNTDFSGLFQSPNSNDSNGEEYFHSKTTLFNVENLVGNCVAVDYNGSSKMAKICEATTLLDVTAPGEYDCIYRNSGDDPFDRGKVLCIADSKQYAYFSKISDLSMKAECIATYSTLSPDQKKYVIDASMLTNDVQNTDDISNARHIITNPEALKMMFRLCGHALPRNLRFKCVELIQEMETTTGRRSAESAMYLSDILNAGITCEQSVEYPSFDECVKILQTYHYGDDDLLKQIALQIRLLARSDSHGCVFALLGNPGVGKTTIAKGIAECLKKTFFTIKCSGKNMVDLGGVSRIYEGARHGAIMQGLCTYGPNSCILLDEFDDITVNDKDGNPYTLFDSVWDDRKVFCDNFTDVPISVKNVCWVITCNSIDTVPAAIKNRFQANIFTINDYSCEKKVEVAKRFTVAQKMRQYNFTDREVQFTDSALLKLAKMTNDAGARVMTQIIEQTLANANLLLENGVNGPIIIDERFIDESAIVSTNSSLRKSIGF